MKIIFITITFLILLITSCNYQEYPIYRYGMNLEVPDSLKDNELRFITETMSAADFHLKTSDYEDPEYVIRECKITFESINGVLVEGLRIKECSGCYCHFIPYERLDSTQKVTFVKLKK